MKADKDIYKLELHEETILTNGGEMIKTVFYRITRVPGGFLYERVYKQGYHPPVFVPYTPEKPESNE